MAADVVFVVNQGLEITTDRLLDSPNGNQPQWVAMGIGATPATALDTDLETPGVDEARTVGVMTQVMTTTADDTLQVVGTITCLVGAKAIVECALFSHLTSAAGFLYLRATFDAINLQINDSIEFTIQVVYDQA